MEVLWPPAGLHPSFAEPLPIGDTRELKRPDLLNIAAPADPHSPRPSVFHDRYSLLQFVTQAILGVGIMNVNRPFSPMPVLFSKSDFIIVTFNH